MSESKNSTEILFIHSTLKQLDWEVPKHDSLVAKTFALSFLTGGIGGLAYGSTSISVYGHVKLQCRVEAQPSGGVLIDREYQGEAVESRAKLACDVPDTRRAIVAAALRDAVQKFVKDLESISLTAPSTP